MILFTREVINLYTKRYNTLIEVIEEGENKWKDMPCS